MVKVTGSDLLSCSSNAPKDQTSGSNVTLDPKNQTSSNVGLSLVHSKKRNNLYQKVNKKRWVEEKEEEDRMREQ